MDQKSYPEELMLDAVLQYADITEGKIRLSALADWASKNVAGLEGIKYFHINAKRTRMDPRTGKKEKAYTAAYQRVQEFNKSRVGGEISKGNPLLHSADVDAFLRLPVTDQRRYVLAARETVQSLIRDNQAMRSQNRMLQGEIIETARKSAELEGVLKKIKDEQDAMDRKIALIMEFVGEGQRRAAMRRAGIDGGIDLRAYTASLRDDIKGAFRISAVIRPIMGTLRDADAAIDDDTEPDIIDTIMGGIDI